MLARDFYLNQIIKHKDTEFIKILTGIRRCGKSSLFLLYKDYLLQYGITNEQIIEINYEKFQFDDLRQPQALHDYIQKQITDPEKNTTCSWTKFRNSLNGLK